MALKFIISALEEVAEPLRGEYEAKDGKFHLKVEGHPDAARIVEFRNNNVALLKKLAAFDGVDPVAAKEALARAGDSDVDVVKLKLRLAEAESTAASATQKHDALVFRQAVSAAFLAVGGRPEAVDYIVGTAPYALADDGSLTPKDGAQPTIEEWLQDQTVGPRAFVFQPHKGGGARGATSPTLTLGVRSDVRQIVNPSAQDLGDQKNAKDIKDGRAKVVYTT